MPVQTTKTGYITFPDGGKVSIKENGAATWLDVGAIGSDVTFTLTYEENQYATANAGKTRKQTSDSKIEGAFTLVNLDPEVIEKFGGGMFTKVDTTATPVTTSPDQDISAGWSDNTLYDLVVKTSGSDSTELRLSAKPTLTSVTLDPDGTPEVLVENSEYVLVQNPNSNSGWSIQFISANMSTGSPTTFIIRVDYNSVTPIASSTIHAGTSTYILNAYALKIEHTNSASVIDRSFEIYSANTNSGGIVFSYKGANEDGVEEMPITFTGDIDINREDGKQLFNAYYIPAA